MDDLPLRRRQFRRHVLHLQLAERLVNHWDDGLARLEMRVFRNIRRAVDVVAQCADHLLIWSTVDKVHAKNPGKTLLCGSSPSGSKLIAARWANYRKVQHFAFNPNWTKYAKAIPALLDILAVEGAVVTIDAKLNSPCGCQRAIAEKIFGAKDDYITALKGNKGTLLEDAGLLIKEQMANGIKDVATSGHTTVYANHGRVETRGYTIIHDVEWLRARHAWPGRNGIIVVDSLLENGRGSERETRLYTTSATLEAKRAGPMVRDHWAIENSLHRVMDMTFRDRKSVV